MNRCLFIVLILLICTPAIGQDSTWHMHFAGSGNVNKTNTGTSYIFNNALRTTYARKVVNVNSALSWIYGENTGRKTNNDFLAVFDFDLFKKNHQWYYWGLGGYEKSYSLKITDRIQAGGGIGYNLLDKKNAVIILTDGLLYEKSVLSEEDIYDRLRYETIRNSFRLKYRFVIKEIITIEGVHFLQNSLNDRQDYIIRSSSSIGFRLMKWLSIQTGLMYNKMNLTNKSNLLFTYGINIDQYF